MGAARPGCSMDRPWPAQGLWRRGSCYPVRLSPPQAGFVQRLQGTHLAANRPLLDMKMASDLEGTTQVRALITGAPPGTRTPNPRIKSLLEGRPMAGRHRGAVPPRHGCVDGQVRRTAGPDANAWHRSSAGFQAMVCR